MELTDPITKIKGIGEKTQAGFVSAGIDTISRLLHYFPRDYERTPRIQTIGSIETAGRATIRARILGGASLFRRGGRTVLSVQVSDGSGVASVTYFNMPYLRSQLKPGRELIISGGVRLKGGQCGFTQPQLLTEEAYAEGIAALQPVYPLHKELSAARLKSAIREALPLTERIGEYLPEEVLRTEALLPIGEAIRKLHFPADLEEVYAARRRLAFDEFFLFLYQMEALKQGGEKPRSEYVMRGECTELSRLIVALPYTLTGAQQRALEDILRDMESGLVMNRLVQGDVGSGKTILAVASVLRVIAAGYQAAIMAPTEVLAAQHYADIRALEERCALSFQAELLTGSTRAAEKRRIKAAVAAGECRLVIGTHALLQEDVEFSALALAVTDEQHRFGVGQRMRLMSKGASQPHVLVMSATPIPRTLGLILYGDLDVSLVDELPAKRLPIKNTVLDVSERPKCLRFLLDRVAEGRQAYIICPMVEASEGDDGTLSNVTDYSAELAAAVPAGVRVAMLHGAMKPAQKTEIMERFAGGEIDILVSTTVVEVGVNVPNASVMLIENAERFGLSQLHQLRGRVGRGQWQSYCIFLSGGTKSEKTMERLKVLETTTDGFVIAEEDLRQRGPGDFFGLRQSGLPYFKIADIYTDAELLKRTKQVLERLLKTEPWRLDFLRERVAAEEGLDYERFHAICL